MLILFIVLIGIYGWFLEPTWLDVHEEVVEVSPEASEEVRILFISDLHVGRFSSTEGLRKKIKYLHLLHCKNPFSLILLGGDYIDRDVDYLEQLHSIFQCIKEFNLPVFAVLGNHDYVSCRNSLLPLLKICEDSGIHVLRNEASEILCKGQRLIVIGLDELENSSYRLSNKLGKPSEYKQRASALNWYSTFDELEGGTRILLCHNPDGIYLPGKRPEVALSGHTHGGQMIWLYWFGRFIYPVMPLGSFVTWAGRRIVNGTTLLVSRGISGSLIPFRFMCRPQALVVVLRPKQDKL